MSSKIRTYGSDTSLKKRVKVRENKVQKIRTSGEVLIPPATKKRMVRDRNSHPRRKKNFPKNPTKKRGFMRHDKSLIFFSNEGW